jgi:hypothetical protein
VTGRTFERTKQAAATDGGKLTNRRLSMEELIKELQEIGMDVVVLDEDDDETAMSGFKLVPEGERSGFLPSITQNHFMKLESAYLNVLDKCVPSYTGGYHDFIEFPNGAKAAIFDITNVEKVQVEGLGNHFSGTMTYRAASFCAFLIACNHLAHHLQQAGDQRSAQLLIDNYQKLMDVAYEHEMFGDERTAIHRFLD